jgi:hypothetical protein
MSRQFGAIEFDFKPRFNIALTQKAPVVIVEDGRLELVILGARGPAADWPQFLKDCFRGFGFI